MNAKKIDHIAIAVKDVAQAVVTYENNFGFKADSSRGGDQPEMGMRNAFIPVADVDLEFIQALGDQGPIAEFTANTGEGTYAMAIEVENVAAAVAELRNNGANVTETPDGNAFVAPDSTHGVPLLLMEKAG